MADSRICSTEYGRSTEPYKLEDSEADQEWLARYNFICSMGGDKKDSRRCSLHHILPRSKSPELAKDARNYSYLPIESHWLAHYCLWRASWRYALEFLFVYAYFKKHAGWAMSEAEEAEFKEDCARCRAAKKENKKNGQ